MKLLLNTFAFKHAGFKFLEDAKLILLISVLTVPKIIIQ